MHLMGIHTHKIHIDAYILPTHLLHSLYVGLLHPADGALELLIHFQNLRFELVMRFLQQPILLLLTALCMYVCMYVWSILYYNEIKVKKGLCMYEVEYACSMQYRFY